MVAIVSLLMVTFIYSIASMATYKQEIRDSNFFLPISMSVSIMSSLLWVFTVKTMNDTDKIIAFSMAWDIIIVALYAVIPAMLQEKSIGWQGWIALTIAIAGVLWFKAVTD